MLNPCPHCDQQVIPNGDGACPLCGGVILDPSGPDEPRTPEQPDETGDGEPNEQKLEPAAAGGDASERPPDTDARAAPDESPVWAQTAEDLVAPGGLIGDDSDDGDEDDVKEGVDEK